MYVHNRMSQRRARTYTIRCLINRPQSPQVVVLFASSWTQVAWVVASLRMHRASPINMTPSSFSIDRSSSWRLSIVSFSSANFVAWVFAESVDMPALMKKRPLSSDVMSPARSARSNYVKLFTQVLSFEANIVAKQDRHLRIRRTIYRAFDCVHTGMSLHGHYGGKCYYYSTYMMIYTSKSTVLKIGA